MALLAYVLIRFIGHLGQWKGSFSRLFTLLRGVLFSRLDAYSVMSLCGTARGSPRMIGSCEQAYLPGIASAIAIALGLQVITATLIGAILPLIAAKFKQDPAVVASPALTTIVDITGLLIYFTTAKLLLGL